MSSVKTVKTSPVSNSNKGTMVAIIILFMLFFLLIFGMLISCCQTQNLTTSVDNLTTNNTSNTDSSSSYTNVNVTGILAAGSISDVDSTITGLNTSITTLNNDINTSINALLYSTTGPITIGTLTIDSEINTNGINSSGNIICDGNVSADNITVTGNITTPQLIINDAITITSSKITTNAYFASNTGVQFNSLGTAFTCLQFGMMNRNTSNTSSSITFYYSTPFPVGIIPIIYTTLCGTYSTTGYIVNVSISNNTSFTYTLTNAINNGAVANGANNFYWLAIG